MSRKSLLLGAGIILLLAAGLGGGLLLLLRHEPAFYRRSAHLSGSERRKHSDEFITELSHLFNDVMYETRWNAKFTEEQINSYLDDDSLRSGTLDRSLPEWIHASRVCLQDDMFRLAFRYGAGFWSTVVSLDLCAWLVATEPNVVAVELRKVRAGALPISAQSLLEGVAEAARQRNIDVTWYRHEGHPVALLRFQADRPRPTVQLQHLRIQPGVLDVGGRAIEDVPPRGAP